jgi:hypothetical protein
VCIAAAGSRVGAGGLLAENDVDPRIAVIVTTVAKIRRMMPSRRRATRVSWERANCRRVFGRPPVS